MILRILLSLFLSIPAFPAFALDPIADGVVSEWQKWMAKHGIHEGSLIVSFEGEVVAEAGIKRTVDDVAKVASLSKAITAVCALRAADAAGKTLITPLSEVIPAALADHPPKDAEFADIRLGQLITHTSGIVSDYHRFQLAKLKAFDEENKLWQFSKIGLDALGPVQAQATYRYSNANYLILGIAIEEMTGEPYETYCQREVLEPVGVTSANLNDDWRVLSSWAGWEISARDYLAFAEANFAGDHTPDRPAGFVVSAASLDNERMYGAGMLFRHTGQGLVAEHLGSWRGVKGRVEDPFGAYVALYENGYSVVTNFAHHAWERSISGELESILYTSTHP